MESEAKKMVALTFSGASKLAYLSDKDFSYLVKQVASPGGTTQAALSVFNKKYLTKIIDEAVYAAYKRAAKISKNYERRQ